MDQVLGVVLRAEWVLHKGPVGTQRVPAQTIRWVVNVGEHTCGPHQAQGWPHPLDLPGPTGDGLQNLQGPVQSANAGPLFLNY